MADSVEAAEVAELVELREPNLNEERQEEVQTILDVLKAPSANSHHRAQETRIFAKKNTLILQESFYEIFRDKTEIFRAFLEIIRKDF